MVVHNLVGKTLQFILVSCTFQCILSLEIYCYLEVQSYKSCIFLVMNPTELSVYMISPVFFLRGTSVLLVTTKQW